MKKIALILLICIYAFSSFGIGIKQFYCCGKLKSTNISFVQDSKTKCGMGDETGGCCKTKFKSFKVKDIHIAADGINSPGRHFSELPIFFPACEVLALTNELTDVANASHAPPILYPGTSVYILHCNFRI